MASIAAVNMGWEVAGGKKTTKKLSPKSDKKQVNGDKSANGKMPRIENLAPIQLKATIYDHLQESDDDSDTDKKRGSKGDQRMPSMIHTDGKQAQNAVNKSTSAAKSNAADTVNLLASSINANKKKVASPRVAKNPTAELEKVLGELKVEEFEKEYSTLSTIYPGNHLILNQHMAAFLNQKLNGLADTEPVFAFNESEAAYNKLDKKLLKFYNGIITKLSKTDSQGLFDFCFENILTDNAKNLSNHGFKLVVQLLIKHSSSFLASGSLVKYSSLLNANKHKPLRCLIAMWAIGQFGYYNLPIGVKAWFECMLPFIALKNSASFICSYLDNIFQHHNVSSAQGREKLINSTPCPVDIFSYLKMYELVNEKLTLSKEVAQKLKNSFDIVRAWFTHDLSTHGQLDSFETLFVNLPVDSSSKQADYLFLLDQLLVNPNEQVLAKWKQIYNKHLPQTVILVERLSQRKNHSKQLQATLAYFEEQTWTQLESKQSSQNGSAKQPYYKKSTKTNETIDLTKKLNDLSGKLSKKRKAAGSKSSSSSSSSWLGMIFRTLFFVTLATSVFFYWDVNQNKSTYTNLVKHELAKRNLLVPVQNAIDGVHKYVNITYKWLNKNVPIYYKKASDVVGPAIKVTYKYTKEYSLLAWEKSEPVRDTVSFYVNEAIDYVHVNFPSVATNMANGYEIVKVYFATTTGLIATYLSQFADLVGMQLLGMKHGELEKVLLDSFHLVNRQLIQSWNQFVKYLNQK